MARLRYGESQQPGTVRGPGSPCLPERLVRYRKVFRNWGRGEGAESLKSGIPGGQIPAVEPGQIEIRTGSNSSKL